MLFIIEEKSVAQPQGCLTSKHRSFAVNNYNHINNYITEGLQFAAGSFCVHRLVTFVAIINFSEIIVILPNLCYNECASKGSTTFTSNFVFKHQSQLNCMTEPSITYWKRITNFFSADFSENWYQTLIPKQYQTGWEHREYREKRSKTREISRKLAQNKAKSNCGKELVSEWE